MLGCRVVSVSLSDRFWVSRYSLRQQRVFTWLAPLGGHDRLEKRLHLVALRPRLASNRVTVLWDSCSLVFPKLGATEF